MASLLRRAGRAQPTLSRSIPQSASKITPIALRRQYVSAAAAATPGSSEQPFFPDEPAGPTIQTAIPGPESVKAIERLSKVFDTRSLNMMTNYQRSYGN